MHSLRVSIRAACQFATGITFVRMGFISRGDSLSSVILHSECTLVYKPNPTPVDSPMCANHFQTHHWANRHRDELTTRHTHADALSEREFELFLEACERLPEPKSYEAQLICLLAGRLGLRSGEITHFRKEWIDQDRDLTRIRESDLFF